jgi:hypothetical protein
MLSRILALYCLGFAIVPVAMSGTFHYFELRGKGEAARLILRDQGRSLAMHPAQLIRGNRGTVHGEHYSI